MKSSHFAIANQRVWLLGVAAMLILLFAGAGTVFADTILPTTPCPTNMGSCTAKDMVTTVLAARPVDGDTCTDPGDKITIDLDVSFNFTASTRYDVGFWILPEGDPVNNNACVGSIAPGRPRHSAERLPERR